MDPPARIQRLELAPPEILAQIFSYCTGFGICAIYMCGCRHLNMLMESHGGVTEFIMDTTERQHPRFPRIVSRLRQLTSLSVTGPSLGYHLSKTIDLTILPPTLTNLDLFFGNALASFYLNPTEPDPSKLQLRDLKAMFPRLRTLRYSLFPCKPEYIVPASALPSTVETLTHCCCRQEEKEEEDGVIIPPSTTHLVLFELEPPTTRILTNPSLFPPALTRLQAVSLGAPLAQLTTWTPLLTYLDMSIPSPGPTLEPTDLPPLLQTLILTLPFGEPTHIPARTVECFPRSLHTLQLSGNGKADIDVIPALPPRLTKLSLTFNELALQSLMDSAAIGALGSEEGHNPLNKLLSQVPGTLHYLCASLWALFQDNDRLSLLPPGLKSFEQDAAYWNVDLLKLPPSIRSLTLQAPPLQYTQHSMKLPSERQAAWKRLTKLKSIAFDKHTPLYAFADLALACPQLKTFSYTSWNDDEQYSGPVGDVFGAMPPFLKTLTVQLNQPFAALQSSRLGNWTNLTSLTLERVNNMETPDKAWRSLPATLRSLKISHEHYHLGVDLMSEETGVSPSKKIAAMFDAIFQTCLHLRDLTVSPCNDCECVHDAQFVHASSVPLRTLSLGYDPVFSNTGLTEKLFSLLPPTLLELTLPSMTFAPEFDSDDSPRLGNFLPELQRLRIPDYPSGVPWFAKERPPLYPALMGRS